MGATFIGVSFFAPNGSNPACQELWAKILVKGLFGGTGIMMVWSALRMAALPSRVFCRVILGKKVYRDWLENAKYYDRKQYDKIT